jgi:hypothetical protein
MELKHCLDYNDDMLDFMGGKPLINLTAPAILRASPPEVVYEQQIACLLRDPTPASFDRFSTRARTSLSCYSPLLFPRESCPISHHALVRRGRQG